MDFLDNTFFSFLVLPLLIFVARIADVSLGTIRIIFVARGMKKIAPLIGFFEILIWLLAISKIFQDLDNWVAYIAYAGGFAAGNYIGMLIEERLAIGHEMIRVITRSEAGDLVDELKDKGFGVTFIKAHGLEGEVGVVYIIIKRSMVKPVLEIIQNNNPHALYTIESIRMVNREVFHQAAPPPRKKSLFHPHGKTK
ncbi:MAG: DUF2179 domain-containing protein [Bacteroidales bacterium]|nr:DUF2179 domain-containing protein [Bacteroidales bacterium]